MVIALVASSAKSVRFIMTRFNFPLSPLSFQLLISSAMPHDLFAVSRAFYEVDAYGRFESYEEVHLPCHDVMFSAL